jgi:pantetheine-phosphate adenylyltransferase
VNDLIALYPGTFDMPTNGHVDLIRRAARLFPNVVVAVANNLSKRPLLTVDERVDLLRQVTRDMPTVSIDSFQGLTVEYARRIGARVIVRGLRAISDFEFEIQMALMNQQIASEVETIYLAPAPENSFLSSTLVREVLKLGGDIRPFVPGEVEAYLRKRMAEGGAEGDLRLC